MNLIERFYIVGYQRQVLLTFFHGIVVLRVDVLPDGIILFSCHQNGITFITVENYVFNTQNKLEISLRHTLSSRKKNMNMFLTCRYSTLLFNKSMQELNRKFAAISTAILATCFAIKSSYCLVENDGIFYVYFVHNFKCSRCCRTSEAILYLQTIPINFIQTVYSPAYH